MLANVYSNDEQADQVRIGFGLPLPTMAAYFESENLAGFVLDAPSSRRRTKRSL